MKKPLQPKTKPSILTLDSEVSSTTSTNKLSSCLEYQRKEEKRRRSWEPKANNLVVVRIHGENFIQNHPMSRTSTENRQNSYVKRSTKRMVSSCQSKDKKLWKMTEKLKFSKPSTMAKKSKRNISQLTRRASNNKNYRKREVKTRQHKTKMHDFDLILLCVCFSLF